MRLLLDTHIFLWWAGEPGRLSARVRALCEDTSNELVLSVVSVWEMQIKLQLGKLRLGLPLQDLIATQQRTNGLVILPIELAHVLALQGLPGHHNDPFDRLLIAQANVEGVTLLSADSVFSRYPVTVIS